MARKYLGTTASNALDLVTKSYIEANFAAPVSIETNSTTSWTLVLTDQLKLKLASNASAITVTVPPNASVAWPVGRSVDVCQYGAGQVTVAPGSGVTLRSTPTLKTRAQYSTVTLLQIATNEWLVVGDLAAT